MTGAQKCPGRLCLDYLIMKFCRLLSRWGWRSAGSVSGSSGFNGIERKYDRPFKPDLF